ncbi:TadE/TadG family type IV pilus assembly protein [Sphingomonas bacterium]|uniref:TadE/TadG family type IV pilus assembly protein n=1 Tax=Sphingomonas bacterium TaxID=1895847 RepID=UPI0020C6A9C1|nr:hypothetical protein [Sphingomonas bacterium]
MSVARLPARHVARLASFARRLRDDRGGLALLEFAFTAPLLLGAGLYGVETANLALVNLRVSQITLNLADDAARVGDTPVNATKANVQQLREVDVNDVLQAARYQGGGINLTTNGRIIISSLENVKQPNYDLTAVQRIHWQRCLGKMGQRAADAAYNSHYGTATPMATAGTDATAANAGTFQLGGMGDANTTVNAPPDGAVMFIEVNYQYQPLISAYLTAGGNRIHYIASFIVRDNRDFSQLFNPVTTPATKPSTCDLYSA